MAEGNKNRFSAEVVIEAIFNDGDSNTEDIDCGSGMEICPNNQNEENSYIDISEQHQRLEIERQQQEAIAPVTVLCTHWK